MKSIVFLAVTLAFAVGKVAMQSRNTKKYLNGFSDIVLFNGIVFLGVAVMMTLMSLGMTASSATVKCAIVYGITGALFQIIYTYSLSIGPVSITVMISSLGTIFSVIYGVLFCNESLQFQKIIGLGLFIMALVFSADFSAIKAGKCSKRWFCASLLTMVMAGVQIIVAKVQKQLVTGEDVQMMKVAYICGTVVLFGVLAFSGKVRSGISIRLKLPVVLSFLTVSAFLSGYSPMFLKCIEMMPVSIVSPLLNISSTTCLTIIGIVFFKDKITKSQAVSLLFGLPAILLLTISI